MLDIARDIVYIFFIQKMLQFLKLKKTLGKDSSGVSISFLWKYPQINLQ